MHDGLSFTVCTQHGAVFEALVRGVRMPTESGQIGLRARSEPMLSVIEPGLLVIRADGATKFVATAGGLLEVTRERAVLYTPFAAKGDDGSQVLAALDDALASPDSELLARRRLGELERRIRHEFRPAVAAASAQGDDDG